MRIILLQNTLLAVGRRMGLWPTVADFRLRFRPRIFRILEEITRLWQTKSAMGNSITQPKRNGSIRLATPNQAKVYSAMPGEIVLFKEQRRIGISLYLRIFPLLRCCASSFGES